MIRLGAKLASGLAAVSLALAPLAGAAPGDGSAEAVAAHLEKAQIHLDGERYADVIEELTKATALHANIPGAYYQLGLAHWHLGDLELAKRAFLKELEFDPPDAYSLYYLGRISLSEGSTQEAAGYFERTLEIGTILDVRRRLASSYLSLGQVPQAAMLLEETVRRWPEQGDSHYLLARAYQRLGKSDEAKYEFELAERWKTKLHNEIQSLVEFRMLLQGKKLLEAAAKARALTESGDPDVMLSTAIALGRHGFHGEALPILRRVVDARPDYAEAHYNIGLAQASLQRGQEAVQPLQKAIELRPALYEARVLLGNLLVQGGRHEDAIPHLRAAWAIRPENAKLGAFLGLQYMQGRYYQDAVDTLRKATGLEPGNADLRSLLVDAHYKNHDFERALEEARRALADFPALPNSHYQVAWQLDNMGQFAEAREHLGRALQLDPAFGEARRLLGEMTLRSGDAAGSLPHFRHVLAQDPSSGQAYAGLGKALIQLKRYGETASEMEKAVAVDPDLASLRLYLSQAYRAQGRMDDAKREAAEFTRLNRIRARQRDQDVERKYDPAPPGAGR